MVLSLLSAIFINIEIGNCADESQNLYSGASIVVKEDNPFGIFEWQKNATLMVAKPDQEPPKTSQLTVYFYEVRRGELSRK
jgi:dTDP-glucose pyrophosphorylase